MPTTDPSPILAAAETSDSDRPDDGTLHLATATLRVTDCRRHGPDQLDGETLISLRSAQKHPLLAAAGRGRRGGADRPPTLATLGRWCTQGCWSDGKLIRLQYINVGGKKLTSPGAIERFCHKLNTRSLAPLPEADRARRAYLRAVSYLEDQAGIL